jgi:hypothetical protein
MRERERGKKKESQSYNRERLADELFSQRDDDEKPHWVFHLPINPCVISYL